MRPADDDLTQFTMTERLVVFVDNFGRGTGHGPADRHRAGCFIHRSLQPGWHDDGRVVGFEAMNTVMAPMVQVALCSATASAETSG